MEQIKLSERGEKVNLAVGIESVKRYDSALWDKLHRKIYKNVDKFYDYRYAAYFNASLLIALRASNPEKSRFIASEVVKLLIAEKYQFPLFFVTSELLNSCFNTNPVDEVDWIDMRFPYSSFTFVLEKNSLSIENEQVVCIEVCRAMPSEVETIEALKEVPLSEPKLVITASLESGGTVYKSFNTPFVSGHYGTDIEDAYTNIMSATMKEFGDKVCAAVFNLLYVMAARPELVESGRKLGRHKKSDSELWTPNIIGRKYAVKRPEGYESSGEHGTKRMHWRRGHFRRQPFGKGLMDMRMIWLEPTLVGVKSVVAGENI